MSVLEAMALARPVVASDVGGTRDQVVDGETGYLVPAGDGAAITQALLALATDREQAERMGAAGRSASASGSGANAWSTATSEPSRKQSSVGRPDATQLSRGARIAGGVVRGDEETRHGVPSFWSRSAPARLAPGDEVLLAQARARVRDGRRLHRARRGRPPAARVSINDLVEMHAARRTARTAIERHEPRALIVSSTTAAMLLPSLPMPYAVRLDAPARLNRPGARNALLHAARAPEHATRAGHNSLQRRRRRGASRRGRPAVVVATDRPLRPRRGVGGARAARRRVRARPEGEGARRRSPPAGPPPRSRGETRGLRARSRLGTLASAPRRRGGARTASSCAGPSRRPSSSAPAPRPRLRPRRPLGGLGPGAVRRWPTAPCSRPCRGCAYEGLRVARRASPPGRGGRGAGGAGSGDPRGVRAAGRARRQLPRAGGGAARPYRSDAVQETVARELLPALLG